MTQQLPGAALFLAAALTLPGCGSDRSPQGTGAPNPPVRAVSDAASREQAAAWARDALRTQLDADPDGKAIAFTLTAPREITFPVSAQFRAWSVTSQGIEVHLTCDGREATLDIASFNSDSGGRVERRSVAPEIATTFLLRGAALASARAQARTADQRDFRSSSSHSFSVAFTLEWTAFGDTAPSVVALGPARAHRYPTHPEDVTSPSLEILHREVLLLSASATPAPPEESAKAAEAACARARLALDAPAQSLDSVRFQAQLLSELGLAEDDDRLSRLTGRIDGEVLEGLRVGLELRWLAAPERPERVRQVLSKGGYWPRVRTRAFLRHLIGSPAAPWLAPLLEQGVFQALAEESRKDALAAFLEALPGTDELTEPLPPVLRARDGTFLETARAVADRWHESPRVRHRAKSLLR